MKKKQERAPNRVERIEKTTLFWTEALHHPVKPACESKSTGRFTDRDAKWTGWGKGQRDEWQQLPRINYNNFYLWWTKTHSLKCWQKLNSCFSFSGEMQSVCPSRLLASHLSAEKHCRQTDRWTDGQTLSPVSVIDSLFEDQTDMWQSKTVTAEVFRAQIWAIMKPCVNKNIYDIPEDFCAQLIGCDLPFPLLAVRAYFLWWINNTKGRPEMDGNNIFYNCLSNFWNDCL